MQGTGIFAIVALSMPASAAGRRWGLHGLIVGGMSAASLALVALSLADLAPEAIRSAWILLFNLAGTSALTLHYVNSSPYQMAISTEADRTYQFSLTVGVRVSRSLRGQRPCGLPARRFRIAPRSGAGLRGGVSIRDADRSPAASLSPRWP